MNTMDLVLLAFITIMGLYGYSIGAFTWIIRICSLLITRFIYPIIRNFAFSLREPISEVINHYDENGILVRTILSVETIDTILQIGGFILCYFSMRIILTILKKFLRPKKKITWKANNLIGTLAGIVFSILVIAIIYYGISMLAANEISTMITYKATLDSSIIMRLIKGIFFMA